MDLQALCLKLERDCLDRWKEGDKVEEDRYLLLGAIFFFGEGGLLDVEVSAVVIL